MTQISTQLRRFVIDRANGCCEYCHVEQELEVATFHIEHIRPRKHNGTSEPENLCLSCLECNAYEGSDVASFDPETDELTPFFNQRIDTWHDHFQLAHAEIRPLTAIARVTATMLRFNLPERVDERRKLIKLNRYPCEGPPHEPDPPTA